MNQRATITKNMLVQGTKTGALVPAYQPQVDRPVAEPVEAPLEQRVAQLTNQITTVQRAERWLNKNDLARIQSQEER